MVGRRLLAIVAAVLLAPAGASAAPPPNDDFADATPLGPTPVTVTGDISEATSSPDEENGRSVWYTATPAADEIVELEVCGTPARVGVLVYTGPDLARRTELGRSASEGGCPDGFRYVYRLRGGTTHHIAVNDAGGAKTFTLALRPFTPPRNDAFAKATVLSGIGQATGTTALAGKERGEPRHAYEDQRSIWFRFTPKRTRTLLLSTYGSGSRSGFAVYRGTGLRGLRRVARSPIYAVENTGLRIRFARGVRYSIAVVPIELPGDVLLRLRAP